MEKEKNNEGWGSFFREVIVMMAVMLGIFYLLLTFVISNDRVDGASMQPNFENNERLIAVRHTSLKRNDVVVLYAPKAAQDVPGAAYVKRVIGLPGDKIVSKNDQMYVNGKLLPEPYLENNYKKADNAVGQTFTTNFTYQVPKGYYWVMGDHRDISKDSRFFGPVKRQKIIGKVVLRYWPLNKIQNF
ncbi:signal peptidase I [Lactobacillus sp. ESL0679]|uniref:signal peptidase I n=1 Tax=unclassified Lactobacillus TaxID=2620435 RepID=UPI0023F91829|nr:MULTISPECIES: signal peptidase I [unclassified Lactobacillus]MDF7682764.1 signal peptidase I [Lactobacillus sp. ESL0679]WEV36174.1 signal peptidase I [Lactobacillus sp. ESL0677]